MLARNIDHLLEILEHIIEIEQQNRSPLGYFPALYRKVTVEVKEKIEQKFFDDGARMEKLDVGFANRYLEAYYDFKEGKEITKSWQLAFDAASDKGAVVLQHLFLGMNAHINLDLGIVAAKISPKNEIYELQNDFNKINEILGSLVNEVQRELGKIWPLMKVIDFLSGRWDEALADFSIDIAREGAWKVATDLAFKDKSRDTYIVDLDTRVEAFGKKIYRPGRFFRFLLKFIRLTERGDVRSRIEILR